jgi:anti-anti-sigma factor
MIETRIVGGYTVVVVHGKLMGGPETTEFSSYITVLGKSGIDKLILDLSDVPWINSAGIGALIASFVSFKKANGVIRFANPSSKVKDVLAITKLITVLEVYDSVDSAQKER